MRNDLHQDLCPGCGDLYPVGLIAMVMHDCPLNAVTYHSSAKFSVRQFHYICNGWDALQSFRELLDFPHFKKMPSYKTASEIDKTIYSICRDSEIRVMKRLRAYIELEECFNASY